MRYNNIEHQSYVVRPGHEVGRKQWLKISQKKNCCFYVKLTENSLVLAHSFWNKYYPQRKTVAFYVKLTQSSLTLAHSFWNKCYPKRKIVAFYVKLTENSLVLAHSFWNKYYPQRKTVAFYVKLTESCFYWHTVSETSVIPKEKLLLSMWN
jgi:hypothetical protein